MESAAIPRHSDDDLRRLLALCAGFDEVYCLFNNITMFEDAARLQALAAAGPGAACDPDGVNAKAG